MALPVHRWFRYSAGFSAEWAEKVIADTGARTVLDPFAGSGTTILAAQSFGAESVGIDVHPFVARVARAKLAWTADASQLEKRARRIQDQACHILSHLDSDDSALAGASPLTRKCFPDATLTQLLSLRDTVNAEQEQDAVHELLWLALVAILRKCSPVGTAQWQYVLPQKSKARVAPVMAAFADQVASMAHDMRLRQAQLPSPMRALYVAEDIRSTALEPGWADLVVTSPPYANNFDYADATRLEMTFLGEITSWGDLKPIRGTLVRSCSQQMAGTSVEHLLDAPELQPIRSELRAVYQELAEVRLTKGGKKAYHSMIVAYFHDMAQTWTQLRLACREGAAVCFVVGDSAPYGVHAPVERWNGQLALAAGFDSWTFEKVRDRNVKWENRKHRVPLHEGRLWVRG
jgi:16S rRNA G966 N2-methylase RsmD